MTDIETAIAAHRAWEARYCELAELEDDGPAAEWSRHEPDLFDVIVAAVPVDLADAGRKAEFIAETGAGLDWEVMQSLLRSIASATLPIAHAA